jgi:molybdate transport system substrate-binding protein
MPMILLMMCKSSRTKNACERLGSTVKTVISALLYYQTLVLLCQLLYVPAVKGAECNLLVAAASDLAPLERDLRDAYQKVSPCNLTFTFDASGALRFQIKNGAPYQVFLSASVDYINELNTSGFVVPDTIRVYAYGRLVLWSKKGYSVGDLITSRVSNIAIANPGYAPYGVAARQTLISLGFWEDVQPKLIMAGSVRQAFQYAEAGDADACFTSATIAGGRAGGVPIDPKLHQPIQQTAGVIGKNDKTNPMEARKFLDFLTGAKGQAVLLRHGLGVKP